MKTTILVLSKVLGVLSMYTLSRLAKKSTNLSSGGPQYSDLEDQVRLFALGLFTLPADRAVFRLPRGLVVPIRHQRWNECCIHVIYHSYPPYERLRGGGKPWSCSSATFSFDGMATVMPTLRRHATKSWRVSRTPLHPRKQWRQTLYAQWSALQGLSNQLL